MEKSSKNGDTSSKSEEKITQADELDIDESELEKMMLKRLVRTYRQKSIDLSCLEKLFQKGVSHGVVGSQNLGNTCFLNSAIQCISNSMELTAYFLSQEFKKEINEKNKLGLYGKLAYGWYELLVDAWEGRSRSVNAKTVKSLLSKKAKMFAGFDQNDSHEFITYLLDILHEDLNRITDNPYREIAEQKKDETDQAAAKRFWESHLQRNDSIITDLFTGQFKSTIKCPECHFVSMTYDPFMTLSLPIPSKQPLLEIEGFFVSKYGIRKTYKYKLRVSEKATFGDLMNKLKTSWHIESPVDNMRHLQIFDKRINEINNSKVKLSSVANCNDLLFCYDREADLPEEFIDAPVYLQMNNEYGVYPSLFSLYNTMTYEDLSLIVFYMSRKYIKLPFDEKAYEDEFKTIADDHTKSTENLFKICQEEYNRLFNTPKEELTQEEKEFIDNKPYELLMENGHIQKYIFSTKETQSNSKNTVMNIPDLKQPITNLITMFEDKWKFILKFNLSSKWARSNIVKESSSCRNIPIPQFEEERERGSVTLNDCFESFQMTEELRKNNEWYCNECKKHQLASKKMEIFYLPKLLVIHLKRFKCSRGSFYEKNSSLVDFPINDFDISQYVVGPDGQGSEYDLYAVSQHFGGCGGGHYTAICKNNGKWYDYDDSSVSPSGERSIVSKAAYVLFYRRKN